MPIPSLQPITRMPFDLAVSAASGSDADAGYVQLAARLPLACGIEAIVDPRTPNDRQAVSGLRQLPVLVALLANPDRLDYQRSGVTEQVGRQLLRVAVADALDRWLQVPVNCALMQTERAVLRAETATLLAGGPLRSALLDDAVALIRAVQSQLEQFLMELALPMPSILRRGIRRLLQGVRNLADQGPDADDLRAVAKLGERVVLSRRQAGSARLGPGAWIESHYVGEPAGGLLDPRLVPARVVRFSDDPTLGEIRLTRVDVEGAPTLRVEVPAVGSHGTCADTASRDRLYARFLDVSSGPPAVHARLLLTYGPVLGLQPGEPGRYAFTANLPVEDRMTASDFRVEVVDAAFDRPSVDDKSRELIALRRAAVFLRQWRLLASCRRLGTFAEADLLRNAYAVTGDMTATLEELDGGARRLSTSASDRRRIMTAGAGAPLVAELAYAQELGAGLNMTPKD